MAASRVKQNIDASKVLLIVNSNSALSQAAADYYRTARGLGNHSISYGFSRTDLSIPVSEARQLALLVADYLELHDIDAIVVSADVPAGVYNAAFSFTGGGGANNTIGLCNYLSMCKYEKTYGVSISYAAYLLFQSTGPGAVNNEPYYLPMDFRYRHSDNLLIDFTNADWASDPNNVIVPGYGSIPFTSIYVDYTAFTRFGVLNDWQMVRDTVLVGRLGYARIRSFLPAESLPAIQQMVNSAIAAESAPKNYAAPIHLNWHADFDVTYSLYVTSVLQLAGFTNIKNSQDGGFGWMQSPPSIDYLRSNYPAAIPAGSKDLFAFFGFWNNLSTSATFAAAASAWNFLPGSFSIGGASFGLSEFGVRNLLDGASAAIGCVYEPYSGALAHKDICIDLLLNGAAMIELVPYCSKSNTYWQNECWGDPLYSPFPATGLSDGEFLSVTDATPSRAATAITPARAAQTMTAAFSVTDSTPTRSATWQN